MSDSAAENARLLRASHDLPKTSHGEQSERRHSDILPEWIMRVIANPYDQWHEANRRTGEPVTVIVGCVPEFNQWIKVVFEGESAETGVFVTAYADRQLAKQYGGRPWSNQP